MLLLHLLLQCTTRQVTSKPCWGLSLALPCSCAEPRAILCWLERLVTSSCPSGGISLGQRLWLPAQLDPEETWWQGSPCYSGAVPAFTAHFRECSSKFCIASCGFHRLKSIPGVQVQHEWHITFHWLFYLALLFCPFTNCVLFLLVTVPLYQVLLNGQASMFEKSKSSTAMNSESSIHSSPPTPSGLCSHLQVCKKYCSVVMFT